MTNLAKAVSFFDPATDLTLGSLAEKIGCQLIDGNKADVKITSVSPIEAAQPGSLTFIDNPKYVDALTNTKAAAVICAQRYVDNLPDGVVALVSQQPYDSFAKAMGELFPSAMRPLPVVAQGIAPGAYVDPSALLEDDVTVEHGAVIGPGAQIGKGSLIGPNVSIGSGVQIGRNTSISGGASVVHAVVGDNVIIHSGVRVGCDGFGFAMGPGGHRKIPQIGRVVIQDNVEIGANSCIDRGSNRDTIVGEGTKIDDLVMIGHNVVIGRHCVIVAQCGIAGSSELEDYVVLGGQSAVNGHVKVGMGSQIAGMSGVSADVAPGSKLGGIPARNIKHWLRYMARTKREAAEMDKKTGK